MAIVSFGVKSSQTEVASTSTVLRDSEVGGPGLAQVASSAEPHPRLIMAASFDFDTRSGPAGKNPGAMDKRPCFEKVQEAAGDRRPDGIHLLGKMLVRLLDSAHGSIMIVVQDWNNTATRSSCKSHMKYTGSDFRL